MPIKDLHDDERKRYLTWEEVERLGNTPEPTAPEVTPSEPADTTPPASPEPAAPPVQTNLSWDEVQKLGTAPTSPAGQEAPTTIQNLDKARQRLGLGLVDTAGGLYGTAVDMAEFATTPFTKAVGMVSPAAEQKIHKAFQGQANVATSTSQAARAAMTEVPYSKKVQQAEANGTWWKTPEWYEEKLPEVFGDIAITVAGETVLPGSGLAYASARSGTSARGDAYQRLREKGYDDSTARAMADLEGTAAALVTLATERLALPKMTGKTLPPGLSKRIADSAAKKLAQKAAKSAVARGIKKAAGSTAGKIVIGGLAEGLQETSEDVAGDAAQWLLENDPDAFDGAVQQYLQSFTLGAAGGGVTRGVHHAAAEAGRAASMITPEGRRRSAILRIAKLSQTPEGMTRLRKLIQDGKPSRTAFEAAGLGKDLRLSGPDRRVILKLITPKPEYLLKPTEPNPIDKTARKESTGDGSRPRRFSTDQAKQEYYAKNRAARFGRRMGAPHAPAPQLAGDPHAWVEPTQAEYDQLGPEPTDEEMFQGDDATRQRIQERELAKERLERRNIPDRVQRWINNDAPFRADEPNGVFTNPEGHETIYSQLREEEDSRGVSKYTLTPNKKARIFQAYHGINPENSKQVYQSGLLAALHSLIGTKKMQLLYGGTKRSFGKPPSNAQLLKRAKAIGLALDIDANDSGKFQTRDAVAAAALRQAGYDAVWAPNANNPSSSEYIGLTPAAFVETAAGQPIQPTAQTIQSKPAAPEVTPTEEVPPTPTVEKAPQSPPDALEPEGTQNTPVEPSSPPPAATPLKLSEQQHADIFDATDEDQTSEVRLGAVRSALKSGVPPEYLRQEFLDILPPEGMRTADDEAVLQLVQKATPGATKRVGKPKRRGAISFGKPSSKEPPVTKAARWLRKVATGQAYASPEVSKLSQLAADLRSKKAGSPEHNRARLAFNDAQQAFIEANQKMPAIPKEINHRETLKTAAKMFLTQGSVDVDNLASVLNKAKVPFEDVQPFLAQLADQRSNLDLAQRINQGMELHTRVQETTNAKKRIGQRNKAQDVGRVVASSQIQMLKQLHKKMGHRPLTEAEASNHIIDALTATDSNKFDMLRETAEHFARPKTVGEKIKHGLSWAFTATKGEYAPINRARQLALGTLRKHEAAAKLIHDRLRGYTDLDTNPKLAGQIDAAMSYRPDPDHKTYDPAASIQDPQIAADVRAMRRHVNNLADALIDTGAAMMQYNKNDMTSQLVSPEIIEGLRTAIETNDNTTVQDIQEQLRKAGFPSSKIKLLTHLVREGDSYRRRTYQAFDDPTWKDTVPEADKKAAKAEFRTQMIEHINNSKQLFKNIKTMKDGIKQDRAWLEEHKAERPKAPRKPRAKAKESTKAAYESARAKYESALETWKRDHSVIREQLARRTAALRKYQGQLKKIRPHVKRYAKVTGQELKSFTAKSLNELKLTSDGLDEVASRAVEDTLSWAQTIAKNKAVIRQGRAGDVLTKRKAMLERRSLESPAIRRLLGHTRNPLTQYAETIQKQARILASHQFIDAVRDLGAGRFLWKRDAPNRPRGASYQISAPSTSYLAPLNGTYTYPEIYAALKAEPSKQAGDNIFLGLPIIPGLESSVRAGLTVLNPGTHARQGVGNIALLAAAGAIDLMHPKQSLDRYHEAARAAWAGLSGKGTQADLQLYLDAVSHGIAGENVDLGDIRLLAGGDEGYLRGKLKSAFRSKVGKSIPDPLRARLARAGETVDEHTMKLAEKAYEAEDNGPRITLWLAEIDRLTKLNETKTKPLSPEAIKRQAATNARRMFQTYSESGRATQLVRRIGFGPFVSFPIELVRTQANILADVIKESKTPADRTDALRRAGALVATHAVASGIAASAAKAIWHALGYGRPRDREKEKALREHVAPWNKNSMWTMLPDLENGVKRFYDWDSLNPFSAIWTPVSAAIKHGPTTGLKEAIEPAISEPIIGSALIDAMRNTKASSGGEVYNPQDTLAGKTASITKHVVKTSLPGWMKSGVRMWKAIKGEVGSGGKVYSLMDELAATLGTRITQVDVPEALRWETRAHNDQMQSAKQLLTKVLHRSGNVSPKELATAWKKSERAQQRLFEEMQRKVESAEELDIPRRQVYKILRDNGMSQTAIDELKSGRRTPYSPKTIADADRMLQIADRLSKKDATLIRNARRDLIARRAATAMTAAKSASRTKQVLAARAELDAAGITVQEIAEASVYSWMADREPWQRGLTTQGNLDKMHQLGVTDKQIASIANQIFTGPDAPPQFKMKPKKLAEWMVDKWIQSGKLRGNKRPEREISRLQAAGITREEATVMLKRAIFKTQARKLKEQLKMEADIKAQQRFGRRK